MKKLSTPFLFIFSILFFVSTFSFGQNAMEMQLVGVEKFESRDHPTKVDSFTKKILIDQNKEFISNAHPTIPNSRSPLKVDLNGKEIIIDCFTHAIVNLEVNRIYALDLFPFEGSSRPYNGMRIYDLEGNELKSYLESPAQTFDPWFVVSQTGDLYLISTMPSDSLFLMKFDLNGNQLWKTYFAKKDLKHYYFLPQISSNGNIAFVEKIPISFSRILIFDGNNGKMIFSKNLHHRSKIILFNDNDLICESGFPSLHYSISKNIFTQKIFTTELFYASLSTTDSSKQYFGVCCKDLNGRKNEYLFLLFKKDKDDFVLYKKINLSDYIHMVGEFKYYPPPKVNKVLINENGIVSLFYSDNKLLKFK